jgi:hypothetical protein
MLTIPIGMKPVYSVSNSWAEAGIAGMSRQTQFKNYNLLFAKTIYSFSQAT